MLTQEENELITRVGPGTLMGNLFRQYWLPAMLASEVSEPDGDPLRIKLLGEELVAFRDTHGQVALIQNNCPHRGASLFFGRNEDSGLRCVYHGWKFATDGTCLDMPNEPAESDFKSKVQARAYPCRERNGVIWAYMGPRPDPPELPLLETNMLPDGMWWVQAIQRECNWLQGLEGDFDTSHAGFLHSGSVRVETLTPGTFAYYMARDKAPKYGVVFTDGGVMYTGYRAAEPGFTYHRIAQFIFPAVSMTPTNVLGARVQNTFSAPMDDTHTIRFSFGIRTLKDGAPVDRNFSQFNYLPNTSGWHGRWRLAENAANDYLIDRDLQRRNVEYSGIRGIVQQDQAITESEGPVYDRTTERLGSSDAAIIQIRRRMIVAATALAEYGTVPPGVDNPDVYAVRSGGVILPADADWVEATRELRKAFVQHPEIEAVVSRERGAVRRA
jgi:phenylpropionate dioxygenase-like ring-hydroxylating dioxygenase large terminal subunit